MRGFVEERREILPAFVGTVTVTLATLTVMRTVEPWLVEHAHELSLLPTYDAWMAGIAAGDPLSTGLWFLGDVTDGGFMRSVPATALLLTFSLVAAHLENIRSPHAGTGVGGNGRIYTRMLLTAFASMLIARLVYPNQYATGWAPSVTPFIAAQAMVSFFEATPLTCAFAALWAGLTAMPVGVWAFEHLATPLGLPTFPALVVGMMGSYLSGIELLYLLPFAERRRPPAPGEEPQVPVPTTPGRTLVRRMFADYADLVFSGSDLGGMGFVGGLLLGWLFNPAHGVYGSGRTAAVVCCFALVSALALFLWWPTFRREGSVFSLVGMLSVGSVALTYGTSPVLLVPTVAISAIACPALIRWLTATTSRLVERWPMVFYIQTTGVVVTLALSVLAKALLSIMG